MVGTAWEQECELLTGYHPQSASRERKEGCSSTGFPLLFNLAQAMDQCCQCLGWPFLPQLTPPRKPLTSTCRHLSPRWFQIWTSWQWVSITICRAEWNDSEESKAQPCFRSVACSRGSVKDKEGQWLMTFGDQKNKVADSQDKPSDLFLACFPSLWNGNKKCLGEMAVFNWPRWHEISQYVVQSWS